MNRLDFAKSIDYSDTNIETAIKEYFDEVMALYDLVARYNNFSIQSNISNTDISFNLTFNNKKELNIFKNIVSETRIYKYNKIFKCKINKHNDKMLQIYLIEKEVS